jgi:alkylated DNA repair dioxygenase AlkB
MSAQCQFSCDLFYKQKPICQADPCVSVGINCQSVGASNSTFNCQSWCCEFDTRTYALFITILVVIGLCIIICAVVAYLRFCPNANVLLRFAACMNEICCEQKEKDEGDSDYTEDDNNALGKKRRAHDDQESLAESRSTTKSTEQPRSRRYHPERSFNGTFNYSKSRKQKGDSETASDVSNQHRGRRYGHGNEGRHEAYQEKYVNEEEVSDPSAQDEPLKVNFYSDGANIKTKGRGWEGDSASANGIEYEETPRRNRMPWEEEDYDYASELRDSQQPGQPINRDNHLQQQQRSYGIAKMWAEADHPFGRDDF